jgi:hypothetical protein
MACKGNVGDAAQGLSFVQDYPRPKALPSS